MARNQSVKYHVKIPVSDSGGGGDSGRYINMPTGADIARIRERLNLTQREFAERFGFEIEALRNWEQEKRTPNKSATVLLRMVEKFPDETRSMIDVICE